MSNENNINSATSALEVDTDDVTGSTITSAHELGPDSPVPTTTSHHEPVTDSPVPTATSDHEPVIDDAHSALRPRISFRKPKKISY